MKEEFRRSEAFASERKPVLFSQFLSQPEEQTLSTTTKPEMKRNNKRFIR